MNVCHTVRTQTTRACTILLLCSAAAAVHIPAQGAETTPLSTLASGSFARQIELPKTKALAESSPLLKKAFSAYDKLNFSPEERFRYAVTYLGVNAGEAEITLQNPVEMEGDWAHRITAEVKSASWYGWLVKLYDSAEEISKDGGAFTPLRFYLNQLEKNYQSTKLLEYNPNALSVKQRSRKNEGPETTKEFQYPQGTKEALGALYYLRAQLASSHPPPLNLEFPIFTSEKTWIGKAAYRGTETRGIGKSKYVSDVYHLVTTFGGLMEQKGDIRIWFTQDERKLPIHIEAYLKFGHIKVTLDEWDPGRLQRGKHKQIRHDL